jgi:hypothetical protein
MNVTVKAIPTVYGGLQFRSRLEARWAAFFDLIGWSWSYEPIDLDGYIPDFIVTPNVEPVRYGQTVRPVQPLLVEVKPVLTLDGFAEYEGRIQATAWPHEALVVGAQLLPATCCNSYGHLLAGWLAERWPGSHEWSWGPAVLYSCGPPAHVGLLHGEQSYHCRICGWHCGKDYGDAGAVTLRHQWREAQNRTQWQPAEARW